MQQVATGEDKRSTRAPRKPGCVRRCTRPGNEQVEARACRQLLQGVDTTASAACGSCGNQGCGGPAERSGCGEAAGWGRHFGARPLLAIG